MRIVFLCKQLSHDLNNKQLKRLYSIELQKWEIKIRTVYRALLCLNARFKKQKQKRYRTKCHSCQDNACSGKPWNRRGCIHLNKSKWKRNEISHCLLYFQVQFFLIEKEKIIYSSKHTSHQKEDNTNYQHIQC